MSEVPLRSLCVLPVCTPWGQQFSLRLGSDEVEYGDRRKYSKIFKHERM